MPLQNRVTPFGTIISSSSRGMWMGNRGVLHKQQQIIRPFKLLNWVTCVLEYHGVRRKVMSEGRYTELFFLDEATAFAAGHRPCAECRRKEYSRFKELWLKANKDHYALPDNTMKSIDRVNHTERMNSRAEKITYPEQLGRLPNGAMIVLPGTETPFLNWNKQLLEWSEHGYTRGITASEETMVTVLTPKSFVRVFEQGYTPQVHPSAAGLL